LTTLRRYEMCRLTFRILMDLPGRPELARSGQGVCFFHTNSTFIFFPSQMPTLKKIEVLFFAHA
jgi:hypothetical protein